MEFVNVLNSGVMMYEFESFIVIRLRDLSWSRTHLPERASKYVCSGHSTSDGSDCHYGPITEV